MSAARRRTKQKEISREASLESRPVRNPALKVTRQEDDTVLLGVPSDPARWVRALAKLLRVKDRDMERSIGLDEIGTYVWDMCDGETPVRAMIGRFTKKYKLNRKEAEVSMAEYLRTLAKKGLIGIIVPEDPERAN